MGSSGCTVAGGTYWYQWCCILYSTRIPAVFSEKYQWLIQLFCTARILRIVKDQTSFTGGSIKTNTRMILSLVCVLVCLLTSNAMDYGRSCVYDSPLANDYYVKRFGFMFGGGRSGKLGMEALQKTADLSYKSSLPASLYNPSGLYGLSAMRNSVYDFPQPRKATPSFTSRYTLAAVNEKKMVELSPLRLKSTRKQKPFDRFMAVP